MAVRPVPPAAPAHGAPLHALVLQGGGALGAYQAGAYAALQQAQQPLDWVTGISIGAINAALMAGNPPERRLERLQAFWQRVSLELPWAPAAAPLAALHGGWDQAMAWWGMCAGVPGFFRPRSVLQWWPQPPLSWYDCEPLRQSLLELVDFARLNDGSMRFSIGAVDVQSGNFVYFDNRHERIAVEHVLASGALPPGFAPVTIGGRSYWDGGLVSNTPLAYVMQQLQAAPTQPVTVFQIDLFRARGPLPRTLADVAEREKDIRYSSRTRLVSDWVRERYAQHQRLRQLAAHVPEAERHSAAVQALLAGSQDPALTLVHVIHRRAAYESQSKDYAFSGLAMQAHWQAGEHDMAASLRALAAQGPAAPGEFRVIDHAPDAPAAAFEYYKNNSCSRLFDKG